MTTHHVEHYHLTREWPFSVVLLDRNEEVIEVLALANNAGVAYAAFEEALKHRSNSFVQMRNVGRIMHTRPTIDARRAGGA